MRREREFTTSIRFTEEEGKLLVDLAKDLGDWSLSKTVREAIKRMAAEHNTAA